MLRSGQPISSQWRTINAQGRSGQFTRFETINALMALSGRRRHLLVGGGGIVLREYDKTHPYTDTDCALVSPDNDVVTTGVIDPDSGLSVKAVPGIYIYVSPLPSIVKAAGVADKYHIPAWPPPQYSLATVYTDHVYPDLTDDGIAANKIFWFLFGAYPWPLCTKDNAGNIVPRIVNAGEIPDGET